MKRIKIVFKCYIITQFAKEEIWLNKMSEKGWQLMDSFGFFYIFTFDDSKVYEYKLQYIPGRFSASKQIDYFNFMKSMGIEKVTRYLNWAYFRKEKTNEPFELFSDEESTKKYIKQLQRFIIPIAYINLVCGILNVPIGICNLPSTTFNLVVGSINLLLFIIIMITNSGLKKIANR